MDKQTAMMALTFLERVQLNGKEVPAYARVLKALSEIVNPPPEPTQPKPEEETTLVEATPEKATTEGNSADEPPASEKRLNFNPSGA